MYERVKPKIFPYLNFGDISQNDSQTPRKTQHWKGGQQK
jgi:hypothetical protein